MVDNVIKAKTPGKAAISPGSQAPTQMAIRPPPFRLKTAEDRIQTRWLKLMIYGNYGVGKTYLAATSSMVPGMQGVLMVSAEKGDLTITGNVPDAFNNIITVEVTTFKVFNEIYQFLKQHVAARDSGDMDKLRELQSRFTGVPVEDISTPITFRTLIIDSLSEVESFCMNQIMRITDSTRLDEEAMKVEWPEYGKNNVMMLRLTRALRDLPMNVIYTAGEKFKQDEQKKFKYTPDLIGQLAKKCQGFMDMVGYYAAGTRDDKVIRNLYVTPSATGKYDAKHRYSAFKDAYFANPTITSILQGVGMLDEINAMVKEQ